jgi:decaprenylphospho-beta-D-erythro-pentofuranosid-2-ulose 2-reductase
MANSLIVGATSAIAHETARRFAVRGDRLMLVGRDAQKLASIADDLRVLGAQSVETVIQDLAMIEDYDLFVQSLINKFGQLDIVLLAHGTLPDQMQMQQQAASTLQAIQLNGLSYIGLLTPLANYFEKQGSGCIAVITSVAGDRGRQSNYVYGASKNLVTTFCQGLRNRLAKVNVQVLTIKPGFTKTPMTANLPKTGLIPWAAPEEIADGILNAIAKKKDVVYLPRFWQFIMLVIKHIPESIFKKLSL